MVACMLALLHLYAVNVSMPTGTPTPPTTITV
jgi:hypothetical protein